MKVLLCHNHYQQPGGEDHSFEDEARLLELHGHQVVRYTLHNDAIADMGRVGVAVRTVWNQRIHSELRQLMRSEAPELVHFTNTFPLISPAAYYAAAAERIPVIQALRNYRLLCPNALLLRDGQPCELCLGRRVAIPAIVHKCYRDSRAATAVVAGMLATHRGLGTWQRKVNLFYTPSEFARRKYIAGGFPADRIAVKPNFVHPDPGEGSGKGGYAIFAGRLSQEKGVSTLLEAWLRHNPPMPLKILGDGPMAGDVRDAIQKCPKIEWLGRLPIDQTLHLIGEASVLVFPSLAYETFGRSIIESFARGTPVITSDKGASAELVEIAINGYHFATGDASSLAARVAQMATDAYKMRKAARAEYLRHYTADRNYQMLLSIYQRARCRQDLDNEMREPVGVITS
ncbi:MAG TPA: glycosyltransferase family 4 protein [Tepidisphaeraceae bacterium]|jgi:glycosyltransferase involved in cell wall biosynthesis|nr:glycosyltransferase family 4 protein [Tepidisphaeraceae bacterium]